MLRTMSRLHSKQPAADRSAEIIGVSTALRSFMVTYLGAAAGG